MRPRRPRDPCDVGRESSRKGKIESWLTPPEQLEIDSGQETTIDLRPVLEATRQVNGETPTQRVETRRRSREAAARHRQGIDITRRDRLALQACQLGVQKGQVKLGIMDHQRIGSDEPEKFVQDCGKRLLAGEEFRS